MRLPSAILAAAVMLAARADGRRPVPDEGDCQGYGAARCGAVPFDRRDLPSNGFEGISRPVTQRATHVGTWTARAGTKAHR